MTRKIKKTLFVAALINCATPMGGTPMVHADTVMPTGAKSAPGVAALQKLSLEQTPLHIRNMQLEQGHYVVTVDNFGTGLSPAAGPDGNQIVHGSRTIDLGKVKRVAQGAQTFPWPKILGAFGNFMSNRVAGHALTAFELEKPDGSSEWIVVSHEAAVPKGQSWNSKLGMRTPDQGGYYGITTVSSLAFWEEKARRDGTPLAFYPYKSDKVSPPRAARLLLQSLLLSNNFYGKPERRIYNTVGRHGGENCATQGFANPYFKNKVHYRPYGKIAPVVLPRLLTETGWLEPNIRLAVAPGQPAQLERLARNAAGKQQWMPEAQALARSQPSRNRPGSYETSAPRPGVAIRRNNPASRQRANLEHPGHAMTRH